ncbi:hypothetical protein [Hugenholtzia roseola]|uniref:hypothetical protein n=1 Tax=Hugenholtzia roseola TaxID=1002 RepID=UPI00047893E2|nr:hypothetical protein [Hugenholtzia roseola]
MTHKSKKNKNFEALGASLERKANNRTERKVAEEKPLMLFSFKDFQYNAQIPPGQSYEQWQQESLLAYMLEKFGYICGVNRIEAEQQKFLKVYGGFPLHSEFSNPFPDRELVWAVIMNLGGQKRRVVGHLIGHVFYVVFLDAEHRFYPSSKKNT